MATRSNIGIEYPNGRIVFVYCHFDGYLEGNGQVLFDNYKNAESVEELIALGEISALGNDISSTKDYHRWRGEEIHIRETKDRDSAKQQEYCYIFSVKDKQWYVKGHECDWTPLEKALDKYVKV